MIESTDAPQLPLTAKGRATRARILDTAADLILKNGVSGTGLDDVRHAADVSGSQMTHYFHDRASLIKDVIARQADTVVEQHSDPELNGLSSYRDFERWAELIIANQQARKFRGGCNFGSLVGQLVEADDKTRVDLAHGLDRWLEIFRTGLHAMQDTGELRADADPEALAYSMLAAMQGGVLLSQALRSAEPLRSSLNSALTNLRTQTTGRAGAARKRSRHGTD